MVIKKKIIRSKRVNRDKRTTKRSLKRRSFKQNKTNKKSKRTKINRRKKRTKRMSGGMDAQVRVAGGGAGGAVSLENPGIIPQDLPQGWCLKEGIGAFGMGVGKRWTKKYYVIRGKSLNFYSDISEEGEIKVGMGKSEYSIPDLTGANTNSQVDIIKHKGEGYQIVSISLGTNVTILGFKIEGGTTQLQTFLESVINISERRPWNLSRKEYERKIKEEEERKKTEQPKYTEKRAQESKRLGELVAPQEDNLKQFEIVRNNFIELLNKLLNPVIIESIDSFDRGSFGLIVVVTIEGGDKKVLKISLQDKVIGKEPCYEEKLEFDNQTAVNRIRNDITVGVYPPFLCITDIEVIIGFQVLLQRMEDISKGIKGLRKGEPKAIRLPVAWSVLGFMDSMDICISIVQMDYLDGVTLQQFMRSADDDTLKGILEDFRQKINLLHDRGIYHCDLHFGNVMVQTTDNSTRIIDFGRVKLVKLVNLSENPVWREESICKDSALDNQPKEVNVQNIVQSTCTGPPWDNTGASCSGNR